jgi:hypothetical protein
MQYPTFQKKVALSAADLNLAMDALKRARVLPGVGIKLTETLNGTVVSLKPLRTAGGGGSAPEHCAFSISTAGVGTPDPDTKLYPSYEAQIVPGTVNGVLPMNWWDATAKAPTKFVYGPDALRNVYVNVQTTADGIASCELKVEAATPPKGVAVQGANPVEFNVFLGVLYNESVFTIAKGLISARPVTLSTVLASDGNLLATNIWVYHATGCCGTNTDNQTSSGVMVNANS